MYAAWLLSLAGPAHAVDLDDFDVAFTYTLGGQAGNDDVDSALDVALDSEGNAVTVGYLDGAAGNATDAKVVALTTNGSVAWELQPLDSGVADANQGSDDRLEAVSISPLTGALTWCGSRGGAGVGTAARNSFWAVGLDENAAGPSMMPVERYDYQLRAGGSDSLENGCFGIAQTDVTGLGDIVYFAGWGQGNGDTNGQWFIREYSALGAPQGQLLVDVGNNAEYPDQAFDIAVSPINGNFLVVGTQQAVLDVPAWVVRYYENDSDTPLWTHVVPGSSGLDAAARSVVYDEASRKFYVAGTLNNGTGQASDQEWFVVGYEEDGDGQGGPDIDWNYSFGDANGVDDRATGIALDENRDVVVGGTQRDPATGRATWRVVVLSDITGAERSEWAGPDNGGDSLLEGLDFRDERIGLAGSIDDGTGTGPQFASVVIEIDTDEDGVTDTIDACPDDPNKAEEEGVCGCGIPDDDNDGDGILNCEDGCPGDPNKVEPGLCGCGQPDIDSDSDGVLNCDDFCPADPDKVEVGECGCGTPDDDEDGDGIVRCRDACPDTAAGANVNDFGCDAEGDTGDPDGGGGGGGGGCGCQTGDPASASLVLGLALLGWRGRRRRDRV